MKFRILKFLIMYFVSVYLSSCVSPTASLKSGVDGEVVERSREKAPAWASLRPFAFHDQALTFGYVHVESHHPDLPLGIKKTQLNALLQGKNFFLNELKSSINDSASSVKLSYDQIAASAAFHIDEVSEQTWSLNAKIADIFFEKFRPIVATKGLEEFYNIFVMVELPKSAMPEALRNVAKRFKNSGKLELQKIGAAIDSRISLAH